MVVGLSWAEYSGLDLMRSVRNHHPQERCLVLTTHKATKISVLGLRTIRDGRIFPREAFASDLLDRMAGKT